MKSAIKKMLLFGLICILFLLMVILFLNVWKNIYVNKIAYNAVFHFHKDKVESLLMVIDSDRFSLKEKNKAIEALGFIADKRALDKLKSLVTHKKCDHAREVCQYELLKAIRKINSDYYVILGIFYIEKRKNEWIPCLDSYDYSIKQHKM